MKIVIVQDSILFVSGLKKSEFEEAKRFVPEACNLVIKDPETKEVLDTCAIAFTKGEGGVSNSGVVFDSVTDEGYMCKTLVATQSKPDLSNADKVDVVAKQWANLVLKMNSLETQISSALSANETKIATAKDSITAMPVTL